MINKILKGLLLLLIAIGFPAIADVQAQEAICPAEEHQVGYLLLQNLNPTSPQPAGAEDPDFTAALLGTQEIVNGGLVAGIDWFYRDDNPRAFPTTQTGSQVISWWTMANSRITYLHITNTADEDPSLFVDGGGGVPADDSCDDGVGAAGDATQWVHVEILGENCEELVNFCDVFTPKDSHVYDMQDLVTNAGQSIGTLGLVGREGTIVITSVSSCSEAGPVHPLDEHNFFAATTRVIENSETDYGFNAYVRTTDAITGDPADAGGDTGTCQNFNDLNGGGNGMGLDNLGSEDGNLNTLHKDFNVWSQSELGANDAIAGADVILMNFDDEYSNPFLYFTQPAFTDYRNPVIFDHAENGSSCPDFDACFLRAGIDFSLPKDQIFVIETPAEDCSTPGDEDEDGNADCADSDCTGTEFCESGEQCSDGVDNDGVNGIDCADPGCDGEAVGSEGQECEAGGEVSCDDGFDNDGDGAADGADEDCQIETTTGGSSGGGGGSGCSMVGSTNAGTAAVNILLPMMVFGLGFGLRRIRRRK